MPLPTFAFTDHQAVRFPGMHDPLAVAVVSRPKICQYRGMAVPVVTGDSETRGVMIGDQLEMPLPPALNCRLAFDVDSDAFRSHFPSLLQSCRR
jgi:purine nucleosidase